MLIVTRLAAFSKSGEAYRPSPCAGKRAVWMSTLDTEPPSSIRAATPAGISMFRLPPPILKLASVRPAFAGIATATSRGARRDVQASHSQILKIQIERRPRRRTRRCPIGTPPACCSSQRPFEIGRWGGKETSQEPWRLTSNVCRSPSELTRTEYCAAGKAIPSNSPTSNCPDGAPAAERKHAARRPSGSPAPPARRLPATRSTR